MKKKTIILLSALIALMLLIIASAVYYLYSGLDIAEGRPAAAKDSSVFTETEVVKEDKDAAKENTSKAEPVNTEPVKEESAKSEPVKTETAAAAPVKKEAPKATGKKEFKVKNCATGKQNTLKQNSDNSLCLIDHNGKKLWTIQFEGPIVGEPAEVDMYNNLKIQFLIVSGSRLHCIDRLGREVKSFPLSLGSEATGGPKDVKSGKLVYWQIPTASGKVYFDKKNRKIVTKLP